MRRRVSSRDVARYAGVSQSTVSLVLNNRDARISERTRARVLEAVRELGYSRHQAAHALVTGRTYRIAFVPNTPESFRSHDTYYWELLIGVMDGASRLNYNVVLHSAQFPDWNAVYQGLLSGIADGVLLVGRHQHDPLTDALLESGFPTVCISYVPDRDGGYAVDCENETAGYLAARHLLELGHRRLSFIAYGASTSWARERHAGSVRALVEAGLDPATLSLLDATPGASRAANAAERAMELLAEAPTCPTAVIFSDEWLAQRVVEAWPARGIRVPDDMAVVTFNSTLTSERARPPLTAVWQPLSQIGDAAMDLLAQLIDGQPVPPGIRRFPVRLDVRASCGSVSHRREEYAGSLA